AFLAQRKVSVALGHRADGHMSALISSLQGIINALLNGQLVLPNPQGTMPLDPCLNFTAIMH
ncbi:MAG: hypothetical protein IJA89_01045, partial [Clostridia bacterium]|nr:hypothetical protein [Clostridia bacterium]